MDTSKDSADYFVKRLIKKDIQIKQLTSLKVLLTSGEMTYVVARFSHVIAGTDCGYPAVCMCV